MSGLRRLTHSLSLLVFVVTLGWGMAFLLSRSSATLAFYANSYGPWSLAERIAGRLWAAKTAGDKPVALFIGGSSTWGAIDEEILNADLPEWLALNAGAAQGATVIPELQMHMLERYNVTPDVLVIGLSALTLRDMPVEISGNGYGAFLDGFSGFGYVEDSLPASRAVLESEILRNTLWPLYGLARQVDREIRNRLWSWHRDHYWGSKRRQEDFSLYPGELQATPRNYLTAESPGVPMSLAEIAGTPQRWGKLFPSSAGLGEQQRLRRLLQRAFDRTPSVVVAIMPEHSAVRGKVLPNTIPAFFAVLKEFESRGLRLIDMRDSVPDEGMHDGMHIRPSARVSFNHALASQLAGSLRPRPAN